MERIEAAALREWLEAKRPVTVIDVRTQEDRDQWSIPGSIHLDAYEALKAGQPTALSKLPLEDGVPVVTVCGMGKMSERAAEELAARHIQAFSLAGGMKAWSLAWNVAELDLPGIRVVQIRRTGKGCLSYLICSGAEAMAIDASLPPDVYLGLASERGARIRYAADTHIHADHLSRSRLLAEQAGAELLLPPQERARFPFRPWHEGEEIQFGAARLVAMATPGHTAESTCYRLGEHALFSGDTLFPQGVGRPDLHANPTEAKVRAGLLYRSVERLLRLPAGLALCAGHAGTPTPFDGVFVAEPLGEVAERLGPWMESERSFVERVLARIPPTPPNHERIAALNEDGTMPPGDITDLEAGANRCAVG